MRIKSFFSVTLLCLTIAGHAQYYYNDVLGIEETSTRYRILIENKIKSATASGYDAQGSRTSDFNEWQSIDAVHNMLLVTSRNGQQVSRQLYQFNENFQLQSIIDSTTDFRSTTTYKYQNGKIAIIKIVTEDATQGLSQTEEHQWFYTNNNPSKLLRIINGSDSSEYRFTSDADNNIIDEKRYLRNTPIDSVLYYYDDNNHLSDIVRYDKKVKKLLPDFMFEHDEKGRVIQKISILSATNPNYLIWRYAYNDKGLKTKEALFNKDKELQGRIDYVYTE